MTPEGETLFPPLDPPSGGAARLRAKLGEEPGQAARAVRRVWAAGAVGAATLAAIVAVVLVVLDLGRATDTASESDAGSLYAAAAFDRLLGRESAPYALSVTQGTERLIVRELPSSNPNVRIVELEPTAAGASIEDSAR